MSKLMSFIAYALVVALALVGGLWLIVDATFQATVSAALHRGAAGLLCLGVGAWFLADVLDEARENLEASLEEQLRQANLESKEG